MKKKVNKKSVSPWFRERFREKNGWSFLPVNWRGWVSLIVLLAINVFAAIYFNINELILDSWLKMGVVFFLSIFVFVEISKRRTRGMKL